LFVSKTCKNRPDLLSLGGTYYIHSETNLQRLQNTLYPIFAFTSNGFIEKYALQFGGEDNTCAGVIASASEVENARMGAIALFAPGITAAQKTAPRNDNGTRKIQNPPPN